MKPFLMHDNCSSFLQRTTDVKVLCQNGDTNTNFTLQELQTLNAGEWFVRVRTTLLLFYLELFSILFTFFKCI